ncbi:MAG: hypothetical protein JKY29_08840, partial [Gammaproteobacteria bacterium]|nr:hypothetical protein [Gammaproteobacteria bacterium]
QAMPAPQTSSTQLATQQAAVNARQDQTMDALGITSITILDNAGVLDAAPTGLNTNEQTVVDRLAAVTASLQATLDDALTDGDAASQAAHQQGTSNVIGGLAQIGDTDGVTAATGNAAQADPSQAAPAVSAAAANLPNLDADTMTDVLQSAVNGLQEGGDDVTGTTVGTLTAAAINNMPPELQSGIGSDVARNLGALGSQQAPPAVIVAASDTPGGAGGAAPVGVGSFGAADNPSIPKKEDSPFE